MAVEQELVTETELVEEAGFSVQSAKKLVELNKTILNNSHPFTNKPGFLSPDEILFPNYMKVRDAYEVILNETLKNIDNVTSFSNDPLFSPNIERGDWKKFYIKWYNDIDSLARRLMPMTCKIIESIPEVHLAMISVMEPGTRIAWHRGIFAGCLRYQLALQTPKDGNCFIRLVNGDVYRWKDGEDFMFSDLVFHSVENNSNERRIVLFLDVERPMRDKSWTKFLQDNIKIVGLMAKRSNDVTLKGD